MILNREQFNPSPIRNIALETGIAEALLQSVFFKAIAQELLVYVGNHVYYPFHTIKKIAEITQNIFEQMSDNILNDFDQILCEFHVIPVKYLDSHSPYFTQFHQTFYNNVNEILFERYKRILNRLQEQYYIFHVHVNNSIPCNFVGNEIIPPLLELSLVNKNLVKRASLTNVKFPIDGLDYQNKTDRPDIRNIPWNA